MKIIKLYDCSIGAVQLGKQGENLARQIQIYLTPFINTYGNGTAVLLHQRNGDNSPFPVVAVETEDMLLWNVTATDTAKVGAGLLELQWIVGETLAKSVTWSTRVMPALEASGEEPEHAGESWVQQIIKAVQDAGVTPESVEQAVREYLSEHPVEGIDLDDVQAFLAENGYITSEDVPEYDDTQIKQDLTRLDNEKLTAPPTAQIGQFFKVASIDENGHYVLEAVDAPSGGVQDVQVAGSSIVQDGVASIPKANSTVFGAVKASDVSYGNWIYYGVHIDESGSLRLPLSNEEQTIRAINTEWQGRLPITAHNILPAVREALVNTSGSLYRAWTPDEQQAAQRRLGILSSEEVLF